MTDVQHTDRADDAKLSVEELDRASAAVLGWPVEKFKTWVAEAQVYPNSYKSSVDQAYWRGKNVIEAGYAHTAALTTPAAGAEAEIVEHQRIVSEQDMSLPYWQGYRDALKLSRAIVLRGGPLDLAPPSAHPPTSDSGTTHAEGCWSWGRKHYDCALAEVERLTAALVQPAAPATRATEALRQIRARTYSQVRDCQLSPESVAEICDIASAALAAGGAGE